MFLLNDVLVHLDLWAASDVDRGPEVYGIYPASHIESGADHQHTRLSDANAILS